MRNLLTVFVVATVMPVSLASPTDSAPNISYPGPQTYIVGSAITSLTPANSGGAVPATGCTVSTFAGGSYGFADGTGTAASFKCPEGVAVDASGNVYVGDVGNYAIRKITPAGVVTTFAGSGSWGSADGTGTAAGFSYPRGVAVDTSGNLFVADTDNNKIRKITSAGVVTTFASGLNTPRGVAVDTAGNIFVGETGNNKICKITPGGVVTVLAGSGSSGSADGTGTAASFWSPKGVAVDASGNVFVADTYNNKIRKITPEGVVTTFAGSGSAGSANGTGTAATFNEPYAVAIDASGNLFVADATGNKIRKITPEGVVTTFAGSGSGGATDGNGTTARFSTPRGVALDAYGCLYVGDYSSYKIRKIVSYGYMISPALPAGLTFNTTTGEISGTPTAASGTITYTITAQNEYGTHSTTVSIAVNAVPTVTTSAVLNITATTATGNGNITDLGTPNPTAIGVCWNTTGSPTISDRKTNEGAKSSTGAVTTSMTGLAANTTYYVRAYATNTYGTGYGDTVTFTTSTAAPTLTGPSSASINDTTASLGGTVSALNGADMVERGVYWSTISGFTPPGQGTKVGESGTWNSAGAFTVNVTGLPAGQMVYFIAFARNSIGTGYSGESSLNTAKSDQTVTFNVISDTTYGDPPFDITATATSGLSVVFTSSNTNVATISGSTVTIVGVGTTTITASQAGNGTYNPAADVRRTLTVNAAPTPAPTASVTNSAGQAQVQNDVVQAAVGGFDSDLPVVLETNDADSATLTVGNTTTPQITATLDGLTQGTTLNINADAQTQQDTLVITQPSGRNIKIVLVQFPDGTNVGLNLGNAHEIVSSVTNQAGQAMNIDIQTQDTGGDIIFTITYHPPTSTGFAKTVWLAPGGSMTIKASGIPADGVYKLAVSYFGAFLGQTAENDLRLMMVDSNGKITAAAGTADRGNIPATESLGDYGIDTTGKKVWANVDSLGTFAVGVPKQPVEVITTTITNYGCLPFAGVVLGLLFLGFGRISCKNE